MELRKNYLVNFKRKSGEIKTTLEALGCGTLKLWALENTKKTEDTIIFDAEAGNVILYVEGTANFPKIEKDNLGNIDDYCEGLLELLNSEKGE